MLIEVFKSKIHRVRVTASDLNYIGSITIDEDLIEAAGLVVGERVYIVNVNNGERFDTYVIKGKENLEKFVLTVLLQEKYRDDIIIIIAYAQMTPEEAKTSSRKLFSRTKKQTFLRSSWRKHQKSFKINTYNSNIACFCRLFLWLALKVLILK
jgi:aspartate 1-decarboxylase